MAIDKRMMEKHIASIKIEVRMANKLSLAKKILLLYLSYSLEAVTSLMHLLEQARDRHQSNHDIQEFSSKLYQFFNLSKIRVCVIIY